MDGVEFFRLAVGALFARGFAADSVRSALGLKGLSEVWGGLATDGAPAWYLWLDPAPGAFRLQLIETRTRGPGRAPLLEAVFSVRYYPSPAEPVFLRYSALEQALVAGPGFDATNTPRLDHQDRLAAALFHVATIGFTWDAAGEQAHLAYTSLDRMGFLDPGPGPEADRQKGEHDLIRSPQISRELPAWDLGYPLFDVLASLQAFAGRRPPKRVLDSRQPGFALVEGADGGFEPRDWPGAAFRCRLVTFHAGRSGPSSASEEEITASYRRSPWTAVIDTGHPGVHDHSPAHSHGDAGGCGAEHGHGRSHHDCRCGAIGPAEAAARPPGPAVNPRWWSLAGSEAAATTLPCGCC